MAKRPPSAPPGVDLDRFDLLGPLGVGGTAVVFRARDRRLGDVVALKTLRTPDGDALYRLKQEFRALSGFEHPNLVAFYELMQSPTGWAVSMELVDGVDFQTWCRAAAWRDDPTFVEAPTARDTTDLRFARSAPGGRARTPANAITEPIEALPAATLPDLLRLRSALGQLTEGIMALHAAGRIHRDLKPGNVLVTDAGRVVLLDFGLVAEIDQDYTEGTFHQTIAGSAAYMAPEQAVGGPLTEACDWYAVGVMLYEALTGRWPFRGPVYAILTRKAKHDPTPPRELLPDVPGDLESLCMALLRRDPAARPTGPEILAVLRGGRRPGATPLRPPPFRFRDEALADVGRAYDLALAGTPTLAIVQGPAGSGRTALLRAFTKLALATEPQPITLKARCMAWDTVPLATLDALVDNLARVLRRASDRQVRRLAALDLDAAVRRFPVIARARALDLAGRGRPPASDPSDEALAFAQLANIVDVLLDDQPLLMTIDDAHEGDVDSARALLPLVTGAGRRVLVLVSVTSGARAPFVRWLAGGMQDHGARIGTVPLAPLPPEAIEALAADWVHLPPHHAAVQTLASDSDGLPARLRELVLQHQRAGEADAPLDEVRRADLEGLPAAPRRLLELLALAEGPIRTETVVVAAELGVDAVDAVASLRAHRLCDAAGPMAEALQVVSREVAAHVVEPLDPGRRARHHLALAWALERGPDPDPVRLARHLAEGGERERAGEVARHHGRAALERGDAPYAVLLLQLALEHGLWSARERARLQRALSRAHAFLGQPAQALAAARDALGSATGPEALADELEVLAHRIDALDLAAAAERLQQVLDRLDVSPPVQGLLASGRAVWKRWRAREPAPGDAADVALRTDAAWVQVGVLGAWLPTAATWQPRHLELAAAGADPERLVRALAEQAALDAEQGRSGAASLARAEQVLGAEPSPRAQAWLRAAQARRALARGRLEAALRASTEGEVALRRAQRPAREMHRMRAIRLTGLVLAGRLSEVAGQLDALLAAALHDGDDGWRAVVAGRTALVRIAQGRAGEAEAILAPLVDRLPVSVPWAWATIGRLHLGLAEGALPPLDGLHARFDAAELHRAPVLACAWYQALASAHRRQGDEASAAAHRQRLVGFRHPWARAWATLLGEAPVEADADLPLFAAIAREVGPDDDPLVVSGHPALRRALGTGS